MLADYFFFSVVSVITDSVTMIKSKEARNIISMCSVYVLFGK